MRIKINRIIIILGTILFCDVLLPLINETGFLGGSNVLYKIIALFIYTFCAIDVLKSKHFFKSSIKKNYEISLLLVLAVISISWSVNVGVTVQKVIGLIGTTFFGLYLYKHVTLEEYLRIFIIVALVTGIISLFMVATVPNLSIHSDELHSGLWKGAFYHKNLMARFMSFAVIVCALDLKENFTRLNKIVLLFTLFLSFFLLIKTGGKTGLLIAILIVLVIMPMTKAFLRADRKKGRESIFAYLILFFVIIIVLYLIVSNVEEILVSLGGDITLTGRTRLWVFVMVEIFQKPILGYGFGAFWESSHVSYLWFLSGWEAPHGHNGFLDLWLDLGIVGLILLILLIRKYIIYSIKALRINLISIFQIVLLAYLVMYSIPGNSILSQNSFSWYMFVFGMLNTSKTLKIKGKRLDYRIA